MLYDKLLPLEKLPPPTAEKKLFSYGITKENLNKIYLLPFTATQEVKNIIILGSFQRLHLIRAG